MEMNGEDNTRQSFSWVRRWGAALNVLITAAAVLALVAMFNYLSIRHFARFHWNRSTDTELSSRTLQVLASLTNTVKITVYFDPNEPRFPRIQGLLKEYQFASPKIQVVYVDYLRDGTAARKVKQDYKLTSAEDKDVIIFDANGSSVVARVGELSEYDYSDLIAGRSKEVVPTHFKGELVFTSKIYQVATGKKTIAYYMEGHGEHPLVSDIGEGYGKFIALLSDENNFEVRKLHLVGTNEVPSDCSLLIIAGPRTTLAKVELERIQRYLEQGGRALIAFNQSRRSGLEKLLVEWNVAVGDNTVNDRENSLSSTGWDVMPVEWGAHPIVNAVRSSRVLMYMPRSVRALRSGSGRGEDSKVDELLFTGPRTVVFPDIDRREYDPTQSGPKPLMAVVEKSITGLQRGSTRIVVLGDSTLWGNEFIRADANHEFAATCANWLVNQSVLLGGIPPRQIKTYKVTLTQKQMRSVQWILMGGMPGAVFLLGFLVWLRRRH